MAAAASPAASAAATAAAFSRTPHATFPFENLSYAFASAFRAYNILSVG